MIGLLTCVFKVNCFNEKSIAESIGESIIVWHTFGVHLLVLVLPILFKFFMKYMYWY